MPLESSATRVASKQHFVLALVPIHDFELWLLRFSHVHTM